MNDLIAWLKSFRPEPVGADPRERLRGSVGACLGLVMTGLILRLTLGTGSAMAPLLAPMGASAVLLFAVPASPLAQPWSVVGGNLVSALIGVTCWRLIPDPVPAAGAAVCLSISAMFALRCLHPPSGAVALTTVLGSQAIHDLGYRFLLAPLGINTLLLVAMALIYNNATGHRYPHRAAVRPSLRFGLHPEDLDDILDHQSELLDISRDDLLTLFDEMERRARLRAAKPLRDAAE